MYVMHKRARVAIQPDGTTRETHPAETRTFGSGMEMLHFCLRERVFNHRTGGRTYPTCVNEVWLGRSGGRTYGVIDTMTRWEVTYDHIEAMRRAQSACRARLHYRREIAPQWRPDTSVSPTGEVYYADNSVELHEVDKDGNKRQRQTVPPHGDVCF